MGAGTNGDDSANESDTRSEDEEEWKFSVDDFAEADGTTDETEQDGSNVAGSLDSRQPLEPGDIDLENAIFVALGVLLVVGLIVGAMFGF